MSNASVWGGCAGAPRGPRGNGTSSSMTRASSFFLAGASTTRGAGPFAFDEAARDIIMAVSFDSVTMHRDLLLTAHS